MKTMPLAEFHAALRAQGVPSRDYACLKCVACGTVQCIADFRKVGVPEDDIEHYLGFSCIGRFTNAGPKTKKSKPGAGCDWTLGGLFSIHVLEVVTEDGKHHPTFEPATPEEAQAHWKELTQCPT